MPARRPPSNKVALRNQDDFLQGVFARLAKTLGENRGRNLERIQREGLPVDERSMDIALGFAGGGFGSVLRKIRGAPSVSLRTSGAGQITKTEPFIDQAFANRSLTGTEKFNRAVSSQANKTSRIRRGLAKISPEKIANLRQKLESKGLRLAMFTPNIDDPVFRMLEGTRTSARNVGALRVVDKNGFPIAKINALETRVGLRFQLEVLESGRGVPFMFGGKGGSLPDNLGAVIDDLIENLSGQKTSR